MSSQFNLKPSIFFAVLGCLTVALAPWMSGGQEPLAMLLSSAALFLGLVLLLIQPERLFLPSSWLTRVYWMLLAWGVLSLVWSVNRYSTIQWLFIWGSVPTIFYLAYVLKHCRNGLDWFIRAYLLSAAVFSGYGFWLYFCQSYERFTGSLYWPNPAAAYLLPAVVICAHKAVARVKYWPVCFMGFLFFGVAFALTDSRGAMVVILLLFIIYLFKFKSKQAWITLLFGVGMIICLATVVNGLESRYGSNHASRLLGARYSVQVMASSTSISDRVSYLKSSLLMVASRPAVGYGAGTFGDVHPKYQFSATDASSDAHSVYFQILAELGVVGFGLALLLAFLTLNVVRHTSFKDRDVLFICVLGLLVHFGLDIDASYPALLWLLAALVAILYQPPNIERRSRIKTGQVVGLVIVQLLFSVQSYHSFVANSLAAKATAAEEDGDYETAVGYYDGANSWIIINPIWVNKEGIAYLTLAPAANSDQTNKALKLSKLGEKLDPFNAQHYELEGRVDLAKGWVAEAEVAFRESVALDPNNRPEYFSDIVGLLWQTGRSREALDLAKTFLAKYPPQTIANRSTDSSIKPALANLWALSGQIQLGSHNISEAKKSASMALAIYPQSLRGRALSKQLSKQ